MHRSEIQAALSGTMIETRYQPVVRLADRAAVGVEVLARLNHPARGMLLPHLFVPQIEDAGMAEALTEQVSYRAFSDMASPELAPIQLDIALNFPLDVLLVPQALALLDLQRQRVGIAAERVVIELTESQPVEDAPALGIVTSRLRETGYQVVIDDVEPKVALLGALLELPFTGIKLDKNLVKRIANDEASYDFVARMVDIAKRRGLIVTAEGVENTAMWHRLAGLGVDRAQGYLVARPLMAGDVPDWLRRWSKRRSIGQRRPESAQE
jgi:EAL domain-containing protein (putative c-di-GMP-specific phosphodiesterase class I)